MRTLNLRYRSYKKFVDFIDKSSIDRDTKALITIFASHTKRDKIKDIIKEIKSLLPNATICGCSTDGEIVDGKILTNNISLSIMIFDFARFKGHMEAFDGRDGYEIGRVISNKCVEEDTKALILFSSFSGLDAKDILNGIKRGNRDLIVSGTVGADGARFKESFLFLDENILDSGVVAISLSGEGLIVKNYLSHGWEAISKRFTVTKANKRLLYEIDNKDAKELYKHYLGGIEDSKLSYYSLQFPFIKYSSLGKRVTKSIWGVDENGALILSSDIKEGDTLEISFANIKKILSLTDELFQRCSNTPVETIIFFISSARRRFLNDITLYETDILSQIAPSIGGYGFGQFFSNESESLFMNQSNSFLTISESRDISFTKRKTAFRGDILSNYETLEILRNITQVSSNELELLNKKLEFRVSESVREHRKKDSILIHNSRLAQLGEMLGLIAHQWRQPLSAISATTTGMQVKLELGKLDEGYLNDSLDKIEEYVKHLSETIDDFANFFKPTKKREKILIRDMIKKALFIASPLLTKESVNVIKKFESTNLVSTYPNEIIQVLLNLVRNSVNAMIDSDVKDREIYIKEYKEREFNYIEIEDSAGGIDESIMDKIFDPYFSTKNSEKSMGLGLYMSKFIIEESCKGEIEVKNGKFGAKFIIKLPS
jgi:signal transduction histidine kinase